MGKKLKKDDKNTSEDSFDPLLVESHQAETVVLMLNSIEEDVQIKASEAIYKFVIKCDENKKFLFQLNACDQLIKLLKSEKKTVRRNAIMILAVMCQHSEVRKSIENEDLIVSLLLELLSSNEYLTTNEFAAMALGNLCQDFAIITKLIDNNGVQSLVECLAREDPDVQKNSIFCLNLVLQDFEARPYLKSCDGIASMLELLKSDFPVIQEITLNALAKASLDSSIREVILELGCLNKIVDMIGRPEFSDIHVLCLEVIATCLEDIECVKQLKDNGSLLKLIAFVGDAQPPEDEVKEKPKKTSKSGSGKKKKKEDDEKPTESVSPYTLPEVKVHACKAVMRSCRLNEVRRIFHECDIEKLLVVLLSHDSDSVKGAAARAIGIMSETMECQLSVYNYDGIDSLVKLLKSDHKELKEASVFAIANLTTGNVKNSQKIASLNGLEYLVNCLSFSQEGICSNALIAICNMATEESLRSKLIQNGLIKALVAPLKFKSNSVQSKGALAVAMFLVDLSCRAEFRLAGGIMVLSNLLSSNNADVRRSACWAVMTVVSEKESADELFQIGAFQTLQEMNNSDKRRNKFSESALHRLLDSNLNMKYSLLGYLDFTDQIGDLFYDCGQKKSGSNIESLDKLGLEPINSKRPVLLINSLLPKPATPIVSSVPEFDEKKNSDDRHSKKKKGSKTKKDSRRSSYVNAENPEDSLVNASKNGDLENSVPVYKMPTDFQLLNYVAEVVELITPLETVLDQASELAKFVSNCMGGPILRQELMSFSYELGISELKIEFQSNVIPIGSITSGIQIHRALLFKFLADKLLIPTNLRRGEYNRSWNEIWINTNEGKSQNITMQLFIVDLIHEPGRFILIDSPEGHSYRRL